MSKKDQDLQIDEESLLSLFAESLEEQFSDLEEMNPFLNSLSSMEDRYTEPQLLASGGMKKVSCVYDRKTGRQVALAELHDDMAVEIFEPFLLEAKLTALLEHPNIITVHDIGLSSEQKPYFTMELKVGDSLAEILQQLKEKKSTYVDKFPLRELLNIFLKVCDAMSYAHSQSVLHLDLKPSNIQIGPFGEVLVCDWGLGKVLGNKIFDDYQELSLNPDFLNDITLTGDMKGTPGFMAPEQIKDKYEKTEQTDIYALGAILFNILSLNVPLSGELDEILQKTLDGSIPSPQDLSEKTLPKSLVAVVMKALENEPEQRYHDVLELRHEVDQYLLGFATEAQNASLFTELSLFLKRHKHSSAVALFALSSLLVTTVLFIKNLQASEQEAIVAKEIAESEKQKAQKAKIKSEKALELYRKEKKWSQNFVRDSSVESLIHIKRLTDIEVFDRPIWALENALKSLTQLIGERKPENFKNLALQQGYIHFLRQEFALVSQNPHTPQRLLRVAKELKKRSAPQYYLSPEEFEKLLQRLDDLGYFYDRIMSAQMICYFAAIRQNPESSSPFVLAWLKHNNRQWKEKVFSYSSVKKELVLRGEGLNDLGFSEWNAELNKTIDYCLLESLKLEVLDLSGTSFSQINLLRRLSLKKLDISKTAVRNLDSIKDFKQLRQLTVSSQQFKADELKKLSSHVELILTD